MFNSFDKTLMFLFIPADLVILNDLAIFAFVQKKMVVLCFHIFPFCIVTEDSCKQSHGCWKQFLMLMIVLLYLPNKPLLLIMERTKTLKLRKFIILYIIAQLSRHNLYTDICVLFYVTENWISKKVEVILSVSNCSILGFEIDPISIMFWWLFYLLLCFGSYIK